MGKLLRLRAAVVMAAAERDGHRATEEAHGENVYPLW